MWFVIIPLVLICLALVYEYRVRRPDQIILFETRDGFGFRKARFYPRHFSLALKRTAHSFLLTVDASARGNLDIRVKLAVAVAASLENLSALIRVGGWSEDALVRAAKELEIILQGFVKEYAEKLEIEELSSEEIHNYLTQKVPQAKQSLGLEILSLAIHSFEPVNPQIAEALRQREQARIVEQTEKLNQQARIAAAKSKLKADEEIASLESEVELKKFDLKKAQMEKESALADSRVEDELKRSRMRLDFDKQELELLKQSPELLMLTPQAARLAEASQGLKNARTVVSLSPGDLSQGTELLGMFRSFLHNALGGHKKENGNQ
jgi:hypothetical protein